MSTKKKVKKVVRRPVSNGAIATTYLCNSSRVEELEAKGYKVKKLEGEELRSKIGSSERVAYKKGEIVYMVK